MRTMLRVVAVAVLMTLLVAGGVMAQTASGAGVPAEGVAGRETGAYPFDPAEVAARSGAGIDGGGQHIWVADSEAYEWTPSVAMCPSNEYLVVYQHRASLGGPLAVYGQRLTSKGDYVGGPFQINTDQEHSGYSPDVACEWSQNRFVVVWQYDYNGDGSDYDVHTQLVHGAHQYSGSQLAGSRLWVAWELDDDEIVPAVACNSDDATCLVVFEYCTGVTDIYGQRVGITAGDPILDGDRFVVIDSPNADLKPDVAWGSLDNNYLVVWSKLFATEPAHFRIVITHVYDTEQGLAENELQHEPLWLISPGTWDKDQSEPAVAYNPRCGDQGRYLVTFSYDMVNSDIGAQRLWGTGMFVQGAPFLVAGAPPIEAESHVAANGHLDQFLVTFKTQVPAAATWRYAIQGQRVQGTHTGGSGGQLRGPAIHLYTSGFDDTNSLLGQGDVTGPPYNAGYLAVWHDGLLTSDHNVIGYLFEPYDTYLPCVLRNY